MERLLDNNISEQEVRLKLAGLLSTVAFEVEDYRNFQELLTMGSNVGHQEVVMGYPATVVLVDIEGYAGRCYSSRDKLEPFLSGLRLHYQFGYFAGKRLAQDAQMVAAVPQAHVKQYAEECAQSRQRHRDWQKVMETQFLATKEQNEILGRLVDTLSQVVSATQTTK